MRKKLILMALPCLLFQVCIAQRGLVPGYAITATGDSIAGMLERKTGEKNSTDLQFIPSGQSATRIVNVQDFTGFGYHDTHQYYERHQVTVQMSYMEPFSQSIMYPDSVREVTLFLERIYKGNEITLYKLVDNRTHFFIAKDGQVNELLIRYKSSNTGSSVASSTTEIPVFRDQLRKYFNWTEETSLNSRLADLAYTQSDIVRFVAKIDGGQNQITRIRKRNIYVYAAAGLVSNKLVFMNPTKTVDPVYFRVSSVMSSQVGAGIMLDPNRHSSSFYFGFGASISGMQYRGERSVHIISPEQDELEKYHAQQSTFTIAPQVGYKVLLTGDWAIKTQASLLAHFLLKNKLSVDIRTDYNGGQSTRSYTYSYTNDKILNGVFSAFASWQNKVEAGINYYPTTTNTINKQYVSRYNGIGVEARYLMRL